MTDIQRVWLDMMLGPATGDEKSKDRTNAVAARIKGRKGRR